MTMIKKPELLVTANNVEEVQKLVEAGADAISIGGQEYGLRVAGQFTLDMIKQSVELAHQQGVKVYVAMNALLHNDNIEGLKAYVKELDAYQVDAIVFGDPAVLMTVKQVAPTIELHWNTETTSTNYRTVNYWASKGAKRAVLARELSLDEVIDVKNKVDIEIQAQVHGMTCIFQSKRELVSSYLHYGDKKEQAKDTTIERGLFLREHKRPEEKYPVFEDLHGTHIMSYEDICMIEHIGLFIEAEIDSLKIEGILKPTNYIVEVTKRYRQAIDEYVEHKKQSSYTTEKMKDLQEDKRPLGTGFYFKEQYY